MKAHQLYTRTPVRDVKGKRVRSMWLDSAKYDDSGALFVRSRLVATEVNYHERSDVYAGTPPLKAVKMVISRAASHKGRKKVLNFHDITVAFWHATMPESEPVAVQPPRGEEEPGYLWQLNKA
eukprot:6462025-Amphidinium_carterae.1